MTNSPLTDSTAGNEDKRINPQTHTDTHTKVSSETCGKTQSTSKVCQGKWLSMGYLNSIYLHTLNYHFSKIVISCDQYFHIYIKGWKGYIFKQIMCRYSKCLIYHNSISNWQPANYNLRWSACTIYNDVYFVTEEGRSVVGPLPLAGFSSFSFPLESGRPAALGFSPLAEVILFPFGEPYDKMN